MVERAIKRPSVPSSSGPRPATGIVILARMSLQLQLRLNLLAQGVLKPALAEGEVKTGYDSSKIDDVGRSGIERTNDELI